MSPDFAYDCLVGVANARSSLRNLGIPGICWKGSEAAATPRASLHAHSSRGQSGGTCACGIRAHQLCNLGPTTSLVNLEHLLFKMRKLVCTWFPPRKAACADPVRPCRERAQGPAYSWCSVRVSCNEWLRCYSFCWTVTCAQSHTRAHASMYTRCKHLAGCRFGWCHW